ncbi:MAG TPA: cytochrome bd-I oxidase subunit CydX [Steroidobacteraceae bacterium]|jgi:cyd operon protein YbgT
MWYFSWILGLGLALTFGVLNAIWYEVTQTPGSRPAPPPHSDPRP